MKWNRSETIALAKNGCTRCFGLGLKRVNQQSVEEPCKCVLRAIFRRCYDRFRECAKQQHHISAVQWERTPGAINGPVAFGRKNEEYMADFVLTSNRAIGNDPFEQKLFKFYFLLGADWKLCCRQMKTDRGLFFHAVYRMEEKLGRVFRELQPYPLYPLDEYFGGSFRKDDPSSSHATFATPARLGGPVRPPLSVAA